MTSPSLSSVLGSEIDALTLLGVTKVYGEDIVAVDTVDLEVRDREFLTILGPSGSGKTTVLKLIAGFTSPTSGQIRIDGRDVSRTPPHKRNLGMVFQNYALFPHLTVEENLAFPLEMRRIDRAEVRRRIGQVLDIVRLPGMGKRYPRQLSGGQQQRVALARAIVYEPRVLLMDEPLGALDKRLREDLQVEFKRLHQELGVTVVYVTHDQEEALLLSDRIAIFHNGRIEQIGTGEELYRRPRSPFVGSFIGDSNMFRGTLEMREGVPCVRSDGASFPGTVHPDAGLEPGDPAVLIVRPESCLIAPPESGPTGSDQLTATIQQVIYLGSTVKYVLAYDRLTLYVRLNPQQFDWRLDPGSRTVVRWAAEDAVIVPGD